MEKNPELTQRIVAILLSGYFAPSLYGNVLADTGIHHVGGFVAPLHSDPKRSKRDGNFRDLVLRAYGNRCAVCEFDIRFEQRSVGLEAAHIKWHMAGGPAHVRNGLALCVLHHKLFDVGLFTIRLDHTVQVGGPATGHTWQASLNRYNGCPLKVVPDSVDQHPKPKFLKWHREVVFKPALSYS